MPFGDYVAIAADIAAVFAFGAAAVYLVLRIAQGYFMPSFNMDLQVDRASITADTDAIAVAVNVNQGPIGSVRILYAEVQAQLLDGTSGPSWTVPLCGPARVQLDRSGRPADATWDPSTTGPGSRGRTTLYRLPPGEATVWSTRVDGLPHDGTFLLQVLITGRQKLYPRARSQWRASRVVLPSPGIAS